MDLGILISDSITVSESIRVRSPLLTIVDILGFEWGPGLGSSQSGMLSQPQATWSRIRSADARTGKYSISFFNSWYGSPAAAGRPVSGNLLIGSFYFKIKQWFNVAVDLCYAPVIAGNNHRITINPSTHKLYARFGTNVGNTLDYELSLNTWYRLDVRFKASANPNSIEFMVTPDGSNQSYEATPSTYAQAATTFSHFYLAWGDSLGASASNCGIFYADDLAISYTYADYPIGAHSIEVLRPNANGTSNPSTYITDQDGNIIDDETYSADVLLGNIPYQQNIYLQQTDGTGTQYAEIKFEDTVKSNIICITAGGFYGANIDGISCRGGWHIVGDTDQDLFGIISFGAGPAAVAFRCTVVTRPTDGWTAEKVSDLSGRCGYMGAGYYGDPRWYSFLLEYCYSTEYSLDISVSDSVIVSDLEWIDIEGYDSRISITESVIVTEYNIVNRPEVFSIENFALIGYAPARRPFGYEIDYEPPVLTVPGSYVTYESAILYVDEVEDTVIISDIVFAQVEDIFALASDSVIAIEVTPELTISDVYSDIFDFITVTDTPPAISQSIDVSEEISIILGTIIVSIAEEISVSDSQPPIIMLALSLEVFDSLYPSDHIPVVVLEAIIVEIYDFLIVTESVLAFLDRYFISVSDDIFLTESIEIVRSIPIDISHSVTVMEVLEVTLGDILLTVLDSITVTEFPIVDVMDFVLGFSIAESVTVAEFTDINIFDFVLQLVVTETVPVTEWLRISVGVIVELVSTITPVITLSSVFISLVELESTIQTEVESESTVVTEVTLTSMVVNEIELISVIRS